MTFMCLLHVLGMSDVYVCQANEASLVFGPSNCRRPKWIDRSGIPSVNMQQVIYIRMKDIVINNILHQNDSNHQREAVNMSEYALHPSHGNLEFTILISVQGDRVKTSVSTKNNV